MQFLIRSAQIGFVAPSETRQIKNAISLARVAEFNIPLGGG